jgi:hypothetical protein
MFIGRVRRSKTYRELFLEDDTLTNHLLDNEHIQALRLFRQRVFIGEVGDRLVSLTSSALYPDPASGVEMPSKRLSEDFPSIAQPVLLLPNRFMLIKDRATKSSTTLSREEEIAMSILNGLGDKIGVHSYTADFTKSTGTLAKTLDPRLRFGIQYASHRALVCKDPFHVPAAFGDVMRFVHDQVLGLRITVKTGFHGYFE